MRIAKSNSNAAIHAAITVPIIVAAMSPTTTILNIRKTIIMPIKPLERKPRNDKNVICYNLAIPNKQALAPLNWPKHGINIEKSL